MKKTILAVLAMGALSCALFSQQAQATTISGMIQFGGVTKFDHPLATATEVVQWRDATNSHPGFSTVTGPNTGDFVGILPGTLAAMATPWVFGVTVGGPQPGLWSVGGFTFDLMSSTVVFRDATHIVIDGNGTVSGNGFTPTQMTWSFTSQGGRGVIFSFSANGTAVPDGGSAVALLGIALTGIEVLRRKLRIG
jgi:hypothetical protein